MRKDLSVRLLVIEDFMEREGAVAHSQVVIHQITIVNAQKLLILRPKALNNRVTLATVLGHMGYLFSQQRPDAYADTKIGVFVNHCSLGRYRHTVTHGSGTPSAGLGADLRRLPGRGLFIHSSCCRLRLDTDEIVRFGKFGSGLRNDRCRASLLLATL